MTFKDAPPIPSCIIIGDRLVIGTGKYRYVNSRGVHMVATREGWEETASIVTTEGGYQNYGSKNIGLKDWKIYAPDQVALLEQFKEINETVPLTRFGQENPGVPFVVWHENVCLGHAMVTLVEPVKFPRLGAASGRHLRSTVTNALYTASYPFKLSGSGGYSQRLSAGQGDGLQVTFTNLGNAPEFPVLLEITNAVNPVINLVGTDQAISFPDFTVEEGETLLIDHRKFSVTLDGINVFSAMEGDFFDFAPTTNTLALFGGASGELFVNYNHTNL